MSDVLRRHLDPSRSSSPLSSDRERNRRRQEQTRAWITSQNELTIPLSNPHAPRTPSPLRKEITGSNESSEERDTSRENFIHKIQVFEREFQDFRKKQIDQLKTDHKEIDSLCDGIQQQFKQLERLQGIFQKVAQLQNKFFTWQENYVTETKDLKTIQKEIDHLEDTINSTRTDTDKSFNRKIREIEDLRGQQITVIGKYFGVSKEIIKASIDELRHIKSKLDEYIELDNAIYDIRKGYGLHSYGNTSTSLENRKTHLKRHISL